MLHRQFRDDSCRRGRSIGRGRIYRKAHSQAPVEVAGWRSIRKMQHQNYNILFRGRVLWIRHILLMVGFLFSRKPDSPSGQKYDYENAFSSYAEIVDFVHDHIILLGMCETNYIYLE